MALQFTLNVPEVAPLAVKFTKPNSTRPYTFKVSLNPLALVRTPLTLERAKDGQRNLLAMGELEADNSFVARSVAEWFVPIESALYALAGELTARLRPGGFSEPLDYRLHSIELCADLRTPDPGRVVQLAYERIRSRYRHTIRAGYPSAASYYGVEGDSLMAWGFARRGERIKAYEKTSRRIRLECQLDKHALDEVLSTRILRDADDFVVTCRRLAEHACARFQGLTQGVAPHSGDGHSPTRLLGLAFQDFSPHVSEDALLTLMRTGRLRRLHNPSLVRSWHSRGILQRANLGFYVIADEYTEALNIVAQLADGWMGQIAGDAP